MRILSFVPIQRPLTARQHVILRSVARGKTNKDIAAELGISEQGVKVHISRLLERYGAENRVELVSVTSVMAGLDYFARALGVEPLPLPASRPGEPSRHRPAGAKEGGAWVPIIDPADAAGPEADLYGGGDFVPNIVRALSLVPDEVRVLRRSTDAHYVPVAQIPDPTYHRALARPQMELIAARVSALNQCFY